MKKNTSIDDMLRDFCSVRPPYKFNVRLEENVVKTRSRKPFVAALCASLVLVFAVVLVAGFGKGITPADNPEDFGFIVNAYSPGATDDSAIPDSVEILSTMRTKINKEWPFIEKCYNESSGCLTFQHMALEISGEDIESFDIKSEYGRLHYSDELHRLSAENVIEGGRGFDYFVAGSELYDLPACSEETYLFWIPEADRIDAVAPTFEEQCESLQTAEDYNKYFGDTITVVVKYKDGSEESVDIEISYDDDAYVYAKMTATGENITMY